jgi:hypothetical protein
MDLGVSWLLAILITLLSNVLVYLSNEHSIRRKLWPASLLILASRAGPCRQLRPQQFWCYDLVVPTQLVSVNKVKGACGLRTTQTTVTQVCPHGGHSPEKGGQLCTPSSCWAMEEVCPPRKKATSTHHSLIFAQRPCCALPLALPTARRWPFPSDSTGPVEAFWIFPLLLHHPVEHSV